MSSEFSENAQRFPLYNRVRNDHDIHVYIEEQNKSMHAMGYTEHSFAHIGVVAERTGYILETLGKDDHTVDLALIAAWMHDLGNVVNRVDHSQSGALMTFYLLDKMGFPAEDMQLPRRSDDAASPAGTLLEMLPEGAGRLSAGQRLRQRQ